MSEPGTVTICYTNHRGETALRRIIPEHLEFGRSEWHPEPQWLLWAFDLDRNATRTFAMSQVHFWRQAT